MVTQTLNEELLGKNIFLLYKKSKYSFHMCCKQNTFHKYDERVATVLLRDVKHAEMH